MIHIDNIPGDSIDVALQDQMTPVVILPMAQLLGSTALTSSANIDDHDIEVDSVAGMTVGDHLRIINADADRYYSGTILAIAGNILSLDSPLDFAYIATSEITFSNTNMNVDGSGTPVHFHLRTGDLSIPSQIDITRIIMVCQCSGAVDLNRFGDITGGLTNGIVFRETNGETRNIFNVKTNADLSNIAYDWTGYDASNPAQGIYGFASRLTFGGQSKIGVVLRVEQDGQLGMIIQDDLTSLSSLYCVLEGHIVE